MRSNLTIPHATWIGSHRIVNYPCRLHSLQPQNKPHIQRQFVGFKQVIAFGRFIPSTIPDCSSGMQHRFSEIAGRV